ncbi:MAG: alpha/beta fold hydrolase [Winogradskyella sp.]|nr:alpha/beta fold hydrolase [Winogradskyella sp.]
MSSLNYITITDFKTRSGKTIQPVLSYQNFGKSLDEGPNVLVIHALTGNSNVTGEDGWWNDIIGEDKVIDTNQFCVLAINIPGNNYADKDTTFEHYKDIIAEDIAHLFSIALNKLGISSLFAIIGGSVGGGIAWELAALRPNLTDYLIPIASDWKSTDWIVANCYIQERILEHSVNPLADARLHAMTFYRTPESLTQKFNRTTANSSLFNVESWLDHHGKKLEDRFKLESYKIMNQILKTVDITKGEESFVDVARNITGHIHIITINSDLFFKPEENWTTYVELKSVKENVTIGEIKSIHGHDAFLMEFSQLEKLLKPIFKQDNVIDKHTSINSKAANF